MEILFVVVGLAVGAGLMYLFIKSQLKQIQESHEGQVRRMREGMEQDFALRLETAIKGAQADRDRSIQQVKDDYEQRIAQMQAGATNATGTAAASKPAPTPAPLADPWDNRRNIESTPSPAPVAATPAPAPAPSDPEPPATATPEISSPDPVAPKLAIAQLKQAVNADDSEVRAEVASELAHHLMGAEAEQSLALLEKLAGDRQAEVRIAALETLAEAQIPHTIPVLEKALRDANPAVMRVASRGLQGMKGEPIIFDLSPELLPSNGVSQAED
ncbi:MAG: HEAT repeat domain-containing protein [Cyanobacteria bacterium P01_C01_bin.89]